MDTNNIIIVGLGPGDPNLLTRLAWNLLERCDEIYLRTRQHPVVDNLPSHLKVHSFDHLYESGETFEAVYEQIIERVLELGRRPQGVVYAVPGHPFVAEATSPQIVLRARSEGISVQIVEGMSFLEPTFRALELDPFPHTTLVDALELAAGHAPPFPPDVPALIAQLHSPLVASEVKLTLMALFPDEHPVKLVHAAGTTQEFVEHLALYEIDRSKHIGLLTTLFVPPLGWETSFESFQEVIAHLRAPNGCPWDREQTHQSLRSDLLEETYEVLSALDADDPQDLREELGDLLLQIVLQAQIAAEYGEFTMSDVLQGIHRKIVRRHPHVFGDLEISDSQGALRNWERLKAEERLINDKAGTSLLDGIALALPALTQARQYQQRASRVGFEWSDLQGVSDNLYEQLKEVVESKESERLSKEIGDLLFAVVNLAHQHKVDAESALREANTRFRTRFGFIEAAARRQGRVITDLSHEEIEALWLESKQD